MKENSNSGFLVGLMALLIALVAGVGGYYIFTEVIDESNHKTEDAKTNVLITNPISSPVSNPVEEVPGQ